jgi:uncharacterized protein (TIGR03086 family)
MDPVKLFAKATAQASDVMAGVSPDQMGLPTPCTDWSVQDLVDHMVGSTEYLLAAIEGRDPAPVAGAAATDFDAGRAQVLAGLAAPGALDRTCRSPLGFEWTIGEATAGTFMDNLIHTWDLATATGQDDALDADLVEACTALFLPDMPDRGRAGGLVGPAVHVGADSTAQDRLLAAMGRQP